MLNHHKIKEFHKNGFTIFNEFLENNFLNEILVEVNSIINSDNKNTSIMEMEPEENNSIRRIYEPCSNYPICKKISESKELLDCVEQLIGKNIIFHCRGGKGRAGTVAAILLIDFGYDKKEAIDLVRSKRVGAIETEKQEKFIFSYRAIN